MIRQSQLKVHEAGGPALASGVVVMVAVATVACIGAPVNTLGP